MRGFTVQINDCCCIFYFAGALLCQPDAAAEERVAVQERTAPAPLRRQRVRAHAQAVDDERRRRAARLAHQGRPHRPLQALLRHAQLQALARRQEDRGRHQTRAPPSPGSLRLCNCGDHFNLTLFYAQLGV